MVDTNFELLDTDRNRRIHTYTHRQDVTIGSFIWLVCLTIVIHGCVQAVRSPNINPTVLGVYEWTSYLTRQCCQYFSNMFHSAHDIVRNRMERLKDSELAALISDKFDQFAANSTALLKLVLEWISQNLVESTESVDEETLLLHKLVENAKQTGISAEKAVAVDLSKWLINNLRARGIRSFSDFESDLLQTLNMERFNEDSAVQTFQLNVSNVAEFITRFYGESGFSQVELNQLITAAQLADMGNLQRKVLNFTIAGNQTFLVYYVALRRQGDKIFIATSTTKFEWRFAPTRGLIGFFDTDKMLTAEETNQLGSIMMFAALRNVHANFKIPTDDLTTEDKVFVEKLMNPDPKQHAEY